MRIRNIDLEKDLEDILKGMKDFISRMDYTEFIPVDERHLIEALKRLLYSGVVRITVAEDEEKGIVGGIGMLYAPCMWNQEAIIGEEIFWWVSEEAPKSVALRLLRSAKEQSVSVGCKFVSFKSLTSSPEGVDRIYRKMGLRPLETSYMGAL